jgi:hypothetical protein
MVLFANFSRVLRQGRRDGDEICAQGGDLGIRAT